MTIDSESSMAVELHESGEILLSLHPPKTGIGLGVLDISIAGSLGRKCVLVNKFKSANVIGHIS